MGSYLESPWYSQMQNPQKYQPEGSLNCTSAQWAFRDSENTSIDVVNMAKIADDYSYTNSAFGFKKNTTKGFLCAKQAGPPNRLYMAPCGEFDLWYKNTNVSEDLANYWIIHYDKSEGEAIVIGGQPDYPDQECASTCGFLDYNTKGMWILTRERVAPEWRVSRLKALMSSFFGLDTARLVRVGQNNCAEYDARMAGTWQPNKRFTLPKKSLGFSYKPVR
mmetsp:Transcript_37589/g.84808  ORF Transcript_37589/g.84808 Transcript_37589/m.84808 type:complete len:220 (+) Transcript_37589:437-1096(+)